MKFEDIENDIKLVMESLESYEMAQGSKSIYEHESQHESLKASYQNISGSKEKKNLFEEIYQELEKYVENDDINSLKIGRTSLTEDERLRFYTDVEKEDYNGLEFVSREMDIRDAEDLEVIFVCLFKHILKKDGIDNKTLCKAGPTAEKTNRLYVVFLKVN